ncbi:MAG: HIT family protein [Sphaerochaetaceae bacterium]|nr:HIT family protein [Sphaerochaetaceae bacterium]
MDYCFYCADDEKRKSLMIEIIKMDFSTIYLNKDQSHRGRIIVKLNEHKTEYFQLNEEERVGFFKELAIASEAVYNLYGPNKLNYATFGDLVPHLHVHIVPKYKDRLNWGAAFDDSLDKLYLSEAEYKEMVLEIKHEIKKLLK